MFPNYLRGETVGNQDYLLGRLANPDADRLDEWGERLASAPNGCRAIPKMELESRRFHR